MFLIIEINNTVSNIIHKQKLVNKVNSYNISVLFVKKPIMNITTNVTKLIITEAASLELFVILYISPFQIITLPRRCYMRQKKYGFATVQLQLAAIFFRPYSFASIVFTMFANYSFIY